MFNICRKEMNWGGRKLVIETGKVARQADGAVVVSYGDTVVLCTAVAQKSPSTVDFFPLTVQYQEKYYATGRIPGGFLKREGRPSDNETLVSRLIDRPIRPLFPYGFKNETQVICTVLSHDMENNPDIVSLIGSSAALAISGIPFAGPIGAARVALIDGQLILNPTLEQVKTTQLDLVVAGTSEGVLMVESEAQQLSEEQMLEAVNFGHDSFQPVIKMIEEMARECGKTTWTVADEDSETPKLRARLAELAEDDLRKAYAIREKQDRSERISTVKSQAVAGLVEEGFDEKVAVSEFKELEKTVVRGDILKTGLRIDGRDTKTVRNIIAEVGILPRAHGSALFTRGETQALVVTTLGTGQDEKLVDAIEGEFKEIA